MKRRTNALWILVMFCVPPFGWAQIETHWESALEHRLPGIGSHHEDPVQITAEQRTDLSKCLAATRQVQMVANQMARVGRSWGRGRVNYSRDDLLVFADREQALNAALIALTTDHEELLKSLSQTHGRDLAKRLHKLDRLQTKLYTDNAEVARDLGRARPGSGSPELSWDVYALRRAAAKWKAEHKQIARDLDLEM